MGRNCCCNNICEPVELECVETNPTVTITIRHASSAKYRFNDEWVDIDLEDGYAEVILNILDIIRPNGSYSLEAVASNRCSSEYCSLGVSVNTSCSICLDSYLVTRVTYENQWSPIPEDIEIVYDTYCQDDLVVRWSATVAAPTHRVNPISASMNGQELSFTEENNFISGVYTIPRCESPERLRLIVETGLAFPNSTISCTFDVPCFERKNTWIVEISDLPDTLTYQSPDGTLTKTLTGLSSVNGTYIWGRCYRCDGSLGVTSTSGTNILDPDGQYTNGVEVIFNPTNRFGEGSCARLAGSGTITRTYNPGPFRGNPNITYINCDSCDMTQTQTTQVDIYVTAEGQIFTQFQYRQVSDDPPLFVPLCNSTGVYRYGKFNYNRTIYTCICISYSTACGNADYLEIANGVELNTCAFPAEIVLSSGYGGENACLDGFSSGQRFGSLIYPSSNPNTPQPYLPRFGILFPCNMYNRNFDDIIIRNAWTPDSFGDKIPYNLTFFHNNQPLYQTPWTIHNSNISNCDSIPFTQPFGNEGGGSAFWNQCLRQNILSGIPLEEGQYFNRISDCKGGPLFSVNWYIPEAVTGPQYFHMTANYSDFRNVNNPDAYPGRNTTEPCCIRMCSDNSAEPIATLYYYYQNTPNSYPLDTPNTENLVPISNNQIPPRIIGYRDRLDWSTMGSLRRYYGCV